MPEVLRGDGVVVGLASLLQLAEGEALTGRVVLPRGEVGCHLGNVVRARFGALAGVAAVQEHFLHPGGSFSVETGDEPAAPPLGPTSALVLDGYRLLDDWRRVEALRLRRVDGAALPPALGALAPRLDGRRPVSDVVAAAGAWRCRVIDPLLEALEAGTLVEVAPDEVEDDPPTDPGGFDTAMEAGRRLVREGRYDDARAAFGRALAARPDDRVALQNLRRLAALGGS